jgi:hypothetical protein
MLALAFLSLAILSMANAASTSDEGGGLSLLDIVYIESATSLKDMIDNSPGHTYIKPDLSDVNLLKVSIIDGNDDSVISHMELATNANAAVYRKALYGEIGSDSRA